MADPLYLISGATGTTGRVAVTALRHAGKRVRALVHKEDARAEALREQGAEIVVGELLDLDQVRAAMEGVRGAYFVYPFKPGLIEAAAFFSQAAIEAGVESIVNMSQKSARREAKSEAARDHWITEQVFDWSGVPTTHIRPTFFAEWLLYPMDGWNVKEGVIEFPFADGRHADSRRRPRPRHCCTVAGPEAACQQGIPTVWSGRTQSRRNRREADKNAGPALCL
jgi:uncharacterized protein YbjT (DUF2867 family)